MSKELMLSARELIKAKKYDEARAILKNIDHPKAKEWLATIDKIAPAKTSAAPRQAPAKAPPKAKPTRDDDDPDAFLDEMMARKRPAPQRRPASPKAAAKQSKKPGFRYFVVYGLIFIIFLGAMLFGAVTFLGDDSDPDAQATSDGILTQNAADALQLTADTLENDSNIALTVTAAAETLEAGDTLADNTPEPDTVSTPAPEE